MSKDVEFPKWKGYEDLEKVKQTIGCVCYNDHDQILEYAAKMYLERIHFKNMLLFLQDRIQRHIEEGEVLGLGLDSSREIFGVYIVPAEDVSFPEEQRQVNKEDDIDICEQFVQDMKAAGIEYEEYRGRFFYHGAAVITNEQGFPTFPTLHDVIRATKIPLRWDTMRTGFVVYPAEYRR